MSARPVTQKTIQGTIPCQAIVNNLNVDDVLTEFGNL